MRKDISEINTYDQNRTESHKELEPPIAPFWPFGSWSVTRYNVFQVAQLGVHLETGTWNPNPAELRHSCSRFAGRLQAQVLFARLSLLKQPFEFRDGRCRFPSLLVARAIVCKRNKIEFLCRPDPKLSL